MRFLGYALALVLGTASGVAAVAVHRSLPGILLGAGTAVVVVWTLAQWRPRTATVFAAGWLLVLVAAVAGRGEGDVAVSSDAFGWLLIGSGFVVLVLGVALGGVSTVRHDSGSGGVAT